MSRQPELIPYKKIEQFEGKVLTINEGNLFDIRRTYWINYTTENLNRSEHAHKTLQQVIVAISGSVTIALEGPGGTKYEFTLDNPSEGLYIPPMHWKSISYKKPCILLCFASDIYREDDYIREYDTFKQSLKS